MNREDKKLLNQFQCEFNRLIEENFAQILAERSEIRLFFINENRAFTDGRNIIIDPGVRELFTDIDSLAEAEKYLKLDNSISSDKWLALRMMARAQNIHETLHILYSDFPSGVLFDSRGTTKSRKLALSLISNIIEDAFIEAAGCSLYDNLESFLLWSRVVYCCSNIPAQGTVERAFSVKLEESSPEQQNNSAEQNIVLLVLYLEYMACELLYPMVKQGEPLNELKWYVEETKTLFAEGAVCGDPKGRYKYVQRIFDIIEPIIPGGDEMDIKKLALMLDGMKTHASESASISSSTSSGKIVSVTRRLFTDLDGAFIDISGVNASLRIELERFLREKLSALAIVTYGGHMRTKTGSGYDCAKIHQGIKIEITNPSINLHLKKAYQNICQQYRLSINSHSARFDQLLKGTVDVRDSGHLFGSGVCSKQLGDIKKRCWYRNIKGIDVPDAALLILIDGSGSMEGERREGAMVSSIILHEVLRKNRIEHAVVEHRAIYEKPLVRHTIFVDFNARDEEKYNLMTLKAEEGTREGLSLYWAEQYLKEKSRSENKLIIVISDGVPEHAVNDNAHYLPPVSTKDTFNAVRRIIKRGTKVIAVSLDNTEEAPCYEALREIYPLIVSCTNLKRLTSQLLGIISREFL